MSILHEIATPAQHLRAPVDVLTRWAVDTPEPPVLTLAPCDGRAYRIDYCCNRIELSDQLSGDALMTALGQALDALAMRDLQLGYYSDDGPADLDTVFAEVPAPRVDAMTCPKCSGSANHLGGGYFECTACGYGWAAW